MRAYVVLEMRSAANMEIASYSRFSRTRTMRTPNPLSAAGRGLFKEIGAGATRLKFDIAQ